MGRSRRALAREAHMPKPPPKTAPSAAAAATASAAGPSRRSTPAQASASSSSSSIPAAAAAAAKTATEPSYSLSSWTGKLPATLLQNLCQKHKWHSPSYQTKPTKHATVRVHVSVARDNRKTGKVDRVVYCDERATYDTAQEGRHFAATYALYQINSHMPMHLMLPPPHRDYWVQLDKNGPKTSLHVPGDPFAPAPQPTSSSKSSTSSSSSTPTTAADYRERDRRRQEKLLKSMPYVRMNDVHRERVESALRTSSQGLLAATARHASSTGVSRLFDDTDTDSDAPSATAVASQTAAATAAARKQVWQTVRRAVVDLGFVREHVDTAVAFYRDTLKAQADDLFFSHGDDPVQSVQSKVLDWLCLNVPEPDLPTLFRPKTVNVLETGSRDAVQLARQFMADRLALCGFPRKACLMSLQLCHDDEETALNILCRALASTADSASSDLSNAPISKRRTSDGDAVEDKDNNVGEFGSTDADLKEERREELLALSDILGEHRLQHPSPHQVRVTVPSVRPPLALTAHFPLGSRYPLEPPSLVVHFQDAALEPAADHANAAKSLHVSAHARLCLMRALYTFARDQLAGEPMIYSLVDWLETHGQAMLDRPPPLQSLHLHHIQTLLAAQLDGSSTTITTTSTTSSSTDAIDASSNKQRSSHHGKRPSGTGDRASGAQLLREFRQQQTQTKYKEMQKSREKLPASKHKQIVVEAVRGNRVVVISGETGCGKTTQVPQFLLDDYLERGEGHKCHMVCTQPRRISATAVAARVASERAEPVGGMVGYSVRMETRRSARTRLLFCTTGVLLRQMQSDPLLRGVSHVLVDEVHERNVDTDFLLVLLRRLLERRRDLTLVLMSATLDAQRFSDYFSGAPALHIPGFTFPVETVFLDEIIRLTRYSLRDIIERQNRKARGKDNTRGGRGGGRGGGRPLRGAAPSKGASSSAMLAYYDDGRDDAAVGRENVDDDTDDGDGAGRAIAIPADGGAYGLSAVTDDAELALDYDLIAAVVTHICNTTTSDDAEGAVGAILIFLPGMAEIRQCCNALQNAVSRRSEQFRILPLHSSLTSQEQMRIFERPPRGTRKVVVSTNLAETSITIDDVTHVIDSGRVKETQYDAARGMSCLVDTWTSQASTRQRQGRAGRVRAGVCFKLFRQRRHDRLSAHQTPELLRVPLEQLCLQVLGLGHSNAGTFLAEALDAPDTASVSIAMDNLRSLGAVDAHGAITVLGRHIVQIPADVRIAKLLLFGALLRCLEPILTIAGCIAYRSPFVTPFDKREEADTARRAFATGKSDLLGYVRAHDAWADVVRRAQTPSARRRDERRFCEENFLSLNTLQQVSELRRQFRGILIDIGFGAREGTADAARLNAMGHSTKIIKGALCAGLYPNVCRVEHPETTYVAVEAGALAKDATARELRLYGRDRERVFVHPSSINFSEHHFDDPFVAYHEKVETNKIYLRDTTMVGAYPLLLFGGSIVVRHEQQQICVDNWLSFRAPGRVAVLVSELRQRLDALLAAKITDASFDLVGDPCMDAIARLVESDGL